MVPITVNGCLWRVISSEKPTAEELKQLFTFPVGIPTGGEADAGIVLFDPGLDRRLAKLLATAFNACSSESPKTKPSGEQD